MIRNIIFDWSGTLVDDLPAVWKATNYVLTRMTDDGFRMWSRRVTIGVSVVYLARGLWLVAVP